MTVINTNARSLCPKISSLIDCFSDLNAMVGVVTETWFSDGPALEKDIENLSLGAGMTMISQNRPPNDQGFSHGGVAIVYRTASLSLRRVKLHNPGKFEVVMAEGTLGGSSLVVVGAYIPPITSEEEEAAWNS